MRFQKYFQPHCEWLARYIMCASLACQVWLNISSLARRRRHRHATVRSMRLPSVIVKKGKVVLVVVATWEQQNFLVKTPLYRKLGKYYRNNNIASIEKAYWENLVKSQRVAGNLEYNNWNWPWIFLVKLQCALYYWLSTLCCCGFLKTEKEKNLVKPRRDCQILSVIKVKWK